jgi:hypothetical protein
LLIFGLLTAGVCGCDQKLPSWYPFASHAVNNHGIITPSERIAVLKEQARKAPEITDPGQREAICQGLEQQIRKGEPNSIIRSEILKTLAAYGGPTADAVLRVAVKDPDADVRIVACNLWGKRSDTPTAQVLADVLTSDGDMDVRMAAATGLGHSHDPIAIQALATALDDKDPAMRYRAMESLQESTGKDYGTDPAALDRWRQWLKTGQEPNVPWTERVFPWYR